MRPVIIIPARYESTRFPGKPLAMIAGMSLIERVWRQSIQALPADDVYVATDDDRIADHCRGFGAQVLMTSSSCLTGTDRVHEASLQVEADVYINVQGDEPLIDPADITAVVNAWSEHGGVVNAMCPITSEEDYRSPSVPKVAAAPDGRLLYMSRAPIPTDKSLGFVTAMKQVCIYAFGRDALSAFAGQNSKTPLESIEDIEILRFAECGHDVHMIEVSASSLAVDEPVDVDRVARALSLAEQES